MELLLIVGGWLFGVAVFLGLIFVLVWSAERRERKRREVWDRRYGVRL